MLDELRASLLSLSSRELALHDGFAGQVFGFAMETCVAEGSAMLVCLADSTTHHYASNGNDARRTGVRVHGALELTIAYVVVYAGP